MNRNDRAGDAGTVTPPPFNYEQDGGQDESVRFYDTALQAIKATIPEGGAVRAVGFDSVDELLRAGYRAVDGEADVVIARGGEREFCNAREIAGGGKLILCPTHAYPAAACSAYRTTDDVFAVTAEGKKPDAVVFDATDVDRNLASVFGELAALDLCAFDTAFGERMRGLQPDPAVGAEIAALVTGTTEALRPVCKNREKAARILTGAGRRAARIVERHPELLHASGAAQTAEAVRMLYGAEDRRLGMRGETEMLLAVFVTDFYIKNLSGASECGFPPDNNRRIDSLCEYFKTDVRRACVHTAAIYPPIKMRLCEYRRDEFRSELAKKLAGVKRRNDAAWQVFKWLYPDDGYSIKTLIDRSDLGICLALAPDVFAADTMLSFLKQTGRLDKYIV